MQRPLDTLAKVSALIAAEGLLRDETHCRRRESRQSAHGEREWRVRPDYEASYPVGGCSTNRASDPSGMSSLNCALERSSAFVWVTAVISASVSA